VDDAHWLDDESVAALAFAGRRLARSVDEAAVRARELLRLHGELRLSPGAAGGGAGPWCCRRCHGTRSRGRSRRRSRLAVRLSSRALRSGRVRQRVRLGCGARRPWPFLGLPARSDKHSAGGDACPQQPVMTTGARTCAAPDPEHMPPNTAGTDNDTTDRTHTEPIITEAERTQVPGVAPVADVASARRHPVIRTKGAS
jgi:hypothetical protein